MAEVQGEVQEPQDVRQEKQQDSQSVQISDVQQYVSAKLESIIRDLNITMGAPGNNLQDNIKMIHVHIHDDNGRCYTDLIDKFVAHVKLIFQSHSTVLEYCTFQGPFKVDEENCICVEKGPHSSWAFVYCFAKPIVEPTAETTVESTVQPTPESEYQFIPVTPSPMTPSVLSLPLID